MIIPSAEDIKVLVSELRIKAKHQGVLITQAANMIEHLYAQVILEHHRRHLNTARSAATRNAALKRAALRGDELC